MFQRVITDNTLIRHLEHIDLKPKISDRGLNLGHENFLISTRKIVIYYFARIKRNTLILMVILSFSLNGQTLKHFNPNFNCVQFSTNE